ncbi:MAG: secretion system protein [Chloroflexi bacterium]|jgi:tight adherence protein B|nr:secretion system protein [Chloroflexota bacterium]
MSPLVIAGVALGLVMVVGASAALLLGSGSRQVSQRMEQFVGTYEPVAEPEQPESNIRRRAGFSDRFDEQLVRRDAFDRIRRRIARSDIKLRVSEYILLQILAALGLAVVGYFVLDNIIYAILGAVFGLQLPRIYVNFMANRRLHAFENQLSDTLNLWVNALRSGYSVLQGMEAIATELPPPISREFERVVQEVRLGLSLEQALANLVRRMPSEDLDLIVTAINIQREVGGNLAEILDIISHTIRERVRIKGEIRTLTSQGRLTGWVIGLLPLILAFLVYSINPTYGGQLIVKEAPFIVPDVLPCGWLVIFAGLLMMGFGILAVRKIVDIEV